MTLARTRVLPAWFDLPMVIAAVLTTVYYVVINQEPLKGSVLHQYTTEHFMEYVVVTFFIWGLVDVVFRVCGFPMELLALRQPGLPQRTSREPVARSVALLAQLQQRPQWFLNSRLGQRLTSALSYLQTKESAEGFEDYLRYLANQDDERTHANFGLLRFICWVTPVLGILGTVIHFGSAFGGMSPDQIGDELKSVLGEIGLAFNTTTIALGSAITMMFSLFVCERAERGIVRSINRRVDLELLSRFEVVDESLTPFLHAVQSASRATLQGMDGTLERQLQIWSAAVERWQQENEQRLQSHAGLWEQSLVRIHERFEHSDAQREQKLLRLLSEMQAQREDQKATTQGMLQHTASLHAQFTKLADTLSGLLRGEGELVKLQHTLNDNLHSLRETQQLDQALHGLTAAIHLLTARHVPEVKAKPPRAA